MLRMRLQRPRKRAEGFLSLQVVVARKGVGVAKIKLQAKKGWWR
jgi:hypothetical protein